MGVKALVQELAEREFGNTVVGIDFWGPLDGEDMMGEFLLNPDLSEDEVYERLYRIHKEASQLGWRIAVDWVWNEPSRKSCSSTD